MKIVCNKSEFTQLVINCYLTQQDDTCDHCPLADYCENKSGIEQLVEIKDVSHEPTVIYRTPVS